MNKKLIIQGLAIALFSTMIVQSGYGQTKKKVVKKSVVVKVKNPVTAKVSAAELLEGKALLSKSDCLGCHKLDIKLVGPAYKDVAGKYPASEANYTLLIKKVINGGSGVWGSIPMPPHPIMAPADAKKIVKYVLSIK